MKKIAFLFILTLISAQFAAQERVENKDPQDIGKNYELKINVFNLIAFAAIDLSYERLINEDSSYGVAVFYNSSDNKNADILFPKKFSITPYYRWFFSENKYARGFFIEGFGMLNTFQDMFYNNYDSYENSNKVESQTGFALGVSVGGKFITEGGFTTEILLGVGRNLIKEKNDDYYGFFENNIVGRLGISLGYRF